MTPSNIPSNYDLVAIYHDWAIIRKVFSYSKGFDGQVGQSKYYHVGEHPAHDGECMWLSNNPTRLKCNMCQKELPQEIRAKLKTISDFLKPEDSHAR